MPVDRPPLSREAVARAALTLISAEGLEKLSMRRLAASLGVEAMSLYNHVHDKQDLLAAVVNLVLSDIPRPDPALPWRPRLEAAILNLYAALVENPFVVRLLASDAVEADAPRVLEGVELILAALAEAGLPPDRQVSAFRGMVALCFGFVLTHTSALSISRGIDEASQAGWTADVWTKAGRPGLMRLAPHFSATTTDADLRFILAAYLDAVSSQT